MNKVILLLASAILLAGCAVTPPPAPGVPLGDAPPAAAPVADAYLAVGTEPFWSLEITPARLTFNEPGAAPMVVANPGERRAGDSRTIATPQIALRIVPGPCSDRMSERRFADSVSVRIGNGQRHLAGCGGAILPRATLEGSQWRIVAINDAPVNPAGAAAAGRVAELGFTAGRMTGSAGCNRLSGDYTVINQQLTVGPIMATRMMCADELMTRERAVIAILGAPVSVRYNSRGRLMLTGGAGSILLDPVL